MWEDCLWNYVFPILDNVNHLVGLIKNNKIFLYLSDVVCCHDRLQHRPEMNGRVKSWALEEEKQSTCLFITGLLNILNFDNNNYIMDQSSDDRLLFQVAILHRNNGMNPLCWF